MNAIQNEYGKVWLENNIVHCEFLVDTLNLEEAKSCVELRLKLINGKSYPTFVDIRQIRFVEKDVRKYFASEEAVQLVTMAALVGNSFLSTIAGNFFLTFNKPPIPIKIFNKKDDALKWLSKTEKS